MIKIIFLLIFISVISGCNTDSKEINTTTLNIKDEMAFLPNQDEQPFTGKFVLYYSDHAVECSNLMLQILMTKFGSNKDEGEQNKNKVETIGTEQNHLIQWWHKVNKSQKCIEQNYKGGKLNGIVTEWNENGQKLDEINYKDGKLNGLATSWHDNGQKRSEKYYKDGMQYGLDISWAEDGKESNMFYVSSEISKLSGLTQTLLHEEYDELEQITHYQGLFCTLGCKSQINLHFYKLKSGYLFPKLRLIYRAYDWLFIESFLIVADSQRFEKVYANFKRDTGTSLIKEWYDERISSNDLAMIKAIVNSKEATIRFKGENYYADYEITEREKSDLRLVLKAIEEFSGATILD